MTTKIPVELSSTPGIVDGSNATAITIDSSENVGIGDTSPSAKLEVAGSSNSTYLIAGGDDSSNGRGLTFTSSASASFNGAVHTINAPSSQGVIALSTHSTERMRIDSSGNVGIGTTSPSTNLDVTGDSNSADNMFELKNSKYDSTDSSGETGILFGWNNHVAARIAAFKETTNRTGFKIIGEAGFNVATTIATFKSTGDVGIGTESPNMKVNISHADQDGLRFNTTNSAESFIDFGDTDDNDIGRISYDHADNHMGFRTNNAERMRILSSGQLIMGRTTDFGSTGYKLQVDFSGTTTGILVASDQTASKVALDMRDKNVSGAAGTITYDGLAAQYNTSSDYRLKENIQPLENGLERLNNLKPVKFNWKENGKTNEGFIAHEVQEIFSDAVSGEKDGEDMQGMDYGRITPLLVKAIQEQQEQIEQLKTEIQTLKGE